MHKLHQFPLSEFVALRAGLVSSRDGLVKLPDTLEVFLFHRLVLSNCTHVDISPTRLCLDLEFVHIGFELFQFSNGQGNSFSESWSTSNSLPIFRGGIFCLW